MNEAIKKIVEPNEQQDSLRSEEGKEKATEEVISSSKEGRKKLEKEVITLKNTAKKLRDLADEIDPTDRSESVALSSESQKKENPDPLQQTALEQNSAQENKDPSSSHTSLDKQTTSTTPDQTTSSPKEQLHSTTPAQNTEQTKPSQDNLPPTKVEDSPKVSETPSTTSEEKQAEASQNTQSEAPVSQVQQPTQAPSTNSEKNQLEESQSKSPDSEAPQQAQTAETQAQQPTQTETQPQLSEAQKLAQVQQILGSFEAKFRNLQVESNSIAISAAELSSLDQLSGLLQQAPVLPGSAEERALLINSPEARKDYMDDLKAQIEAEKKAANDLKKIAKLQEKLARVSNHNNYNLLKANSLASINNILQNGTYLDAKLQLPREQKFALELYKNREKLRFQPKVALTIDGSTVEVYNGSMIGQAVDFGTKIDNCNQPVNIVEKLLVENTKMNLDQARFTTKAITTVGVLAGAFYGLKWLLGDKDKEGNRSFGLSPKKLITTAAVLFGGNALTQAATGKGALDLINEFRKTGNNPFTSGTYEKAKPIEQITLDQTASQMALLGVPYAQLAQSTAPRSGPVSSIDLVALQRYYEAQITQARAANLQEQVNQLGAQLSAIKDIINNPNATQQINQTLTSMNLQAQDLANPDNATMTLDELLYKNNNNRKILEQYMETNNLIIAPGKKDEIRAKIIAKGSVLTESAMLSLKDDGLLIPNIPANTEIQKLTISPNKKQALESALRKFGESSEFNNIKLTALDAQQIKIQSDSKEVVINPETLTIPGFIGSDGSEIQLQDHEELLHVALFINQTKAKFWNQMPDHTKKLDTQRPFSQPGGRENFKGRQGIIFKGALSTENFLGSSLPWISEMNQYPTIEKGDTRDHLINYLNKERKKDHPNNYNPTASEKK
ncbi:MAG: hypothetical protein HG456_003055 [candidate division SR1 bacterium]|nr:hypothetical protein [candidate division SR1 bacterium]